MRKFIYLILCVSFLTSCNTFTSNIRLVRNSFLDFDQSTTIGEALDNYQYFIKTEWTEFTTEQGKEVVEFYGYFEDRVEYKEGMQSFGYPFNLEIIDGFVEEKGIVLIQFLMNKDRMLDDEGHRFKVVYVGHIENGRKMLPVKRFLPDIYNNKGIGSVYWLKQ